MFEQNNSLRQLLDIFHQSRNQGMHCKLFLETINGHQFCNVSVHVPAGPPTRKFPTASRPSNHMRKSQSTIRRDQARLNEWKSRKRESVPTQEDSIPNNIDASPTLKLPNTSQNDDQIDLNNSNLNYDLADSDHSNQNHDQLQDLADYNETDTNSCSSTENFNQTDAKNSNTESENAIQKDDHENVQNTPNKSTTEITSNLLPSDFKEMLKKINNQIKDISKDSKHYPPMNKEPDKNTSKIDSEGSSFEDAAVWARNQKKSPKNH